MRAVYIDVLYYSKNPCPLEIHTISNEAGAIHEIDAQPLLAASELSSVNDAAGGVKKNNTHSSRCALIIWVVVVVGYVCGSQLGPVKGHDFAGGYRTIRNARYPAHFAARHEIKAYLNMNITESRHFIDIALTNIRT